jgi:hypothetical protein
LFIDPIARRIHWSAQCLLSCGCLLLQVAQATLPFGIGQPMVFDPLTGGYKAPYKQILRVRLLFNAADFALVCSPKGHWLACPKLPAVCFVRLVCSISSPVFFLSVRCRLCVWCAVAAV